MKKIEHFLPRLGTPVDNYETAIRERYRLSIDPGKSATGWALWSAESGTFHSRVLACGLHEPPPAYEVVIEMPQTYPTSPVPTQDLITLAFLAGRYIGDPEGPMSWCFPHDWKGNVSKEVCERRIRRRLLSEELRIVEECEKLVPARFMNNVWDAIGIGLHAWRGGV